MNYSLEVIDYQLNNAFGKALEEEFERYRSYPKVTQILFKDNKLAEIVKKYTNLKVRVNLGEDIDLHIYSPDINKGNVILDNWRQKAFTNYDTTEFLKRKDFIEGGVDLKNAKVFGDFAEIASDIFIGPMLLSRYSPNTVEELTAAFLHEIGHAFVYLEMLGRLTRTHYLLSEGTQQLLNAKNKEQRVKIFDSIENYTKTTIADKDKLAHGQLDENGYRIIILNLMQKQSIEELDINIYSSRAWEQLADNFAARFGYGRALVVGLDKIHRLYPGIDYTPPIINIFTLLLQTLGFILVWPLLLLLIGMCIFSNAYDLEYDPLKKRFEKFKLQINNAIKDPTLSKQQKLQFIKDYDEIEKVLKGVYENIEFFTILFAIIRPFKTLKMLDIIKTQEELEKLQNNALFTAAARISTLH